MINKTVEIPVEYLDGLLEIVEDIDERGKVDGVPKGASLEYLLGYIEAIRSYIKNTNE